MRLQELSQEEVRQYQEAWPITPIYRLRFIPKFSGLRPIANMGYSMGTRVFDKEKQVTMLGSFTAGGACTLGKQKREDKELVVPESKNSACGKDLEREGGLKSRGLGTQTLEIPRGSCEVE